MAIFFFTLLQFTILVFFIYRIQKSGYWSWPKFFLTILFILFEGFLISAPLTLGDEKTRWFWPICAVVWATVVVNGYFFFRSSRHWKLGPNRG